jgi:hypothetical protein
MGKETPCHLRCDDLTSLVHFIVLCILMVKPETEVMFDDGKGLFNWVVVGGIGWEVLNTTT